MKLCECGCGGVAPLAFQTDTRRGFVKGQPMRFVAGHHARGSNNPTWNGGRSSHSQGYALVLKPEHPRASSNGYVLEHILVAEQAFGRFLPPQAVVHHVNEQRSENRNSNLVICEDDTYHKLLHQRMRAYRATGSVLGVQCVYCKQWGLPSSGAMYTVQRQSGKAGHSYHRPCNTSSARAAREIERTTS